MTEEPIKTKAKYAKAIEKAVEKSVNNHPSVCPRYSFLGSAHERIDSPIESTVEKYVSMVTIQI